MAKPNERKPPAAAEAAGDEPVDIEALKARVTELEQQLEEAAGGADPDRVAELEQQLDAVTAKNAELEQQLQDPGRAWDEDALPTAVITMRSDLEAANERVAQLESQLEEERRKSPTSEARPRSGETRKVTYLGRPDLLQRGPDGEAIEDDVYSGMDPWSDVGTVTMKVGESAIVSREKAEQLAADHSDAFEIE